MRSIIHIYISKIVETNRDHPYKLLFTIDRSVLVLFLQKKRYNDTKR